MQTFLIIIASVVVLILPGFTLYSWLNLRRDDFAENAAICLGLSISLISLLYYLTFYLPLKITPLFLLIFYSACAVLSAFDVIRKKNKITWSPEITITLVLLLSVLILRLFQIRELVLPAWVDSVHHALITRVILENGSIPATLEPYLPVPFSYYFGFHSLAAVVSNLSGQSPEKVILIFGQVLNACIPLAIYRLGRALWDDRTKSLIAALLVAFVSQMPAYYVTWGRYTLLTGLILLIIAIAEIIDKRLNRIPSINSVTLFLLCSAIFLTHYLCGVILLLFSGSVLIYSILDSKRSKKPLHTKFILPIIFSLLVVAYWLFRAFMENLYSLSPAFFVPTHSDEWKSALNYGSYLLKLSGPTRNHLFLLLGILGIPSAFLTRHDRGLAIWAGIIALLALPFGLSLPNVRPDHIIIILFLPLSFCAVIFLDLIWKILFRLLPHKTSIKTVCSLPFLLLLLWGIIDTRNIINPSTIFASESDMIAIQWIKENIPANSRFLINSTLWQGNTYRGGDGGFWLMPITGNFTIPPPVIFTWGGKSYSRPIKDLSRSISDLTTCDMSFWKVINEGEITYIYLNSRFGALQADALGLCENINVVYSNKEVTILQADPGESSQ